MPRCGKLSITMKGPLPFWAWAAALGILLAASFGIGIARRPAANPPPPRTASSPNIPAAVSTLSEHKLPSSAPRPSKSSEEWIAELQNALRSGDNDLFTKQLNAWTRLDPSAAAAFAESLAPGAAREEALRRVAQVWAATDPARAEIWALSLQNEVERSAALVCLCYEIVSNNPQKAIDLAHQHRLAQDPALLGDLSQQWAEKDFAAASSWASEQPAGEPRDQIFARLALVLVKTAPADAVELVTSQIASAPLQAEAAISVVHQWAIKDPVAAAAWVTRFPEGELKTRAQEELAGIARQKTQP
jgi:hypothetical protein